MNIGIIDIIANKRESDFKCKYVNSNMTSIMPQVIAVWLERLGHKVWYFTYTGNERLMKELNIELDVVFISSYTESAYLSYAISGFYQMLGIIRVLGGPHARSYPKESSKYFDYVIKLCDEQLIKYLLEDITRQDKGIILSSSRQPSELAPIKDRWKYIIANDKKTPSFIPIIAPLVSSFGCLYHCEFCIDSDTPYEMLSSKLIENDLEFLNKQKVPIIALWHDPNFGVKFNQTIHLISKNQKNKKLKHMSEMSLSILSENNVKQLKDNNFIGVAPGLESWSSYDNKTGRTSYNSKLEKVESISNQINMISKYIPAVQVNMIFGLDVDVDEQCFELTKEFMKRTPGIYTNFQIITIFGNSTPLSKRLRDENRIINLPFNLMNGYSYTNVKLNYDLFSFYTKYKDLFKYSISKTISLKKLLYAKELSGKLFNLAKIITTKNIWKEFDEFSKELKRNDKMISYHKGENKNLPIEYKKKIKKELRQWYMYLPYEIKEQLQYKE